MKLTSSKTAMPNSNEKSSTKQKLQAPHRNMKNDKVFEKGRNKRKVVDASVAASPHWNKDKR